jgi:hypothetical protein
MNFNQCTLALTHGNLEVVTSHSWVWAKCAGSLWVPSGDTNLPRSWSFKMCDYPVTCQVAVIYPLHHLF